MTDPSLWDLASVIAPLSFATVGGGSGAVADLHRQIVEVHAWMDDAQFTAAYALSRVAPGPGSLFITVLGWQLAGLGGAIVATVAFYLPASMVILALAVVWHRHSGARFLNAMQAGLRPIAAGMILASVYVILGALSGGWIAVALTFLSAAVLSWTRIHPIVVITAGAMLFLGIGQFETF